MSAIKTELGLRIHALYPVLIDRELVGDGVFQFMKVFLIMGQLLKNKGGTKIRKSVVDITSEFYKTFQHYKLDSERPLKLTESLADNIMVLIRSYDKFVTFVTDVDVADAAIEIDRLLTQRGYYKPAA